jgi:TolB-like protein/DNA-binding winged helix-turn-helix (wHTH) protein/Tfp pilus assembly protein PilF
MRQLQHQTLIFGDFTLDLRRGCLLHGSEEVKLRPKSFEVLRHLVENGGRLVSKDELMDAVWPDTAVTDDSLVQCLIEVRRALGDSEQQIIKTVPRRGYILELNVIERDWAGGEVVYSEEVEGVHVTFEDEHEGLSHPQPVVAQLNAASTTKQSGISRQPLVKILVGAAVVLAVIVGGYLVSDRLASRSKSANVIALNAPNINSIAILPFTNEGGNPEMEYLSDGISESLINNLSQLPNLKVIARSSSFKYKGKEVDPQEVANALGVDGVITGRVTQRDQKLLISVELVNPRDKTQTWGAQYTRPTTDVPSVLGEISSDIVAKLRLRLTPNEQQRLTKGSTSNPEAYNYYAKAMYHFHNIRAELNTRPESDLAVDLFKEAVKLDPNYALAHAQLGYTYMRTAVFLENNPALVEEAKKELTIAEKLDPQMAEVHAARYFIAFSQYEGWQVDAAIRELRLAQQLDPDVGHSEFGDIYSHIGLEQQSREAYELALKADPSNDEIKTFYLNLYRILGKPDEYLQTSQRFFNRGPDFDYYIEKRMVNEAEALFDQTFKREPNFSWAQVNKALLLALRGNHAAAQASVPAILKGRMNRGYHHVTYFIARIYALAGKSAEALKWLRITVKEGFPCYPLFARDSFLDRIREDTAFKQFMAELHSQWQNYENEFGKGPS